MSLTCRLPPLSNRWKTSKNDFRYDFSNFGLIFVLKVDSMKFKSVVYNCSVLLGGSHQLPMVDVTA